jgi:hypothetical protein
LRTAQSVESARRRALDSIPEEAAAALLPDGSGFQEVTLATIVVLEEIKSPFITKNASDAPLMEITRALFVLSLPIEQVEMVLAKSKSASQTKAACEPLRGFDQDVRAFAKKIPLSQLDGLAEKIDTHIARSMETAIPHGGKSRSGGLQTAEDEENFRMAPDHHPGPAPASGGNSSTTTS